MTPWQIAKESESSQQVALFCWAAKAELYGFNIANDAGCWNDFNGRRIEAKQLVMSCVPVPELKWLHHIPNGGSRGDNAKSRAIAGGQLKAEGVKAGVLDIFWPFPKSKPTPANHYDTQIEYCGLYIEMKKPSLRNAKNPRAGCSEDQLAFGDFAHSQGYYVTVCYDWLEAAKVIQDYYEGKL